MSDATAEAPAKIAIITVQYNNFSDTVELVRSLRGLERIADCELVVVDNSELPTAEEDQATLSVLSPLRVRLLQPGRNLYYWGGADYALKFLRSSTRGWPQWVIICNNDVTIDDLDFFQRLESLDPLTHPIVAPSIISRTTGANQNPLLESPAGPLPRLKWRVYDLNYRVAHAMLAVHSALKQHLGPLAGIRRHEANKESAGKIYAPHGAFLILSSTFFERGGALDTTVPMFAEELTIAATAQRLGLPIWHRPELKVLHREHSTTGARLTREKYEMERRARRHYFRISEEKPTAG